jgi:ATP/maltotriose-dependent transcriptional regulator MalT
MTVFDDLGAEQDRLEDLLAGLDEAQWLAPSAAEGWTVTDVVLHLAQSEEAVQATMTGGALRTWLACVEDLRGQDEPYWMTVAMVSCGLVETAMGRQEAALAHLREARALAGRFDHPGLSAWSQVQLGVLALARGRAEEARTLLDEGLELSLATRSTRTVTLCLTAFAQLAFVEGDGARAALLAGRPRACASVLVCGSGKCDGRAKPSW